MKRRIQDGSLHAPVLVLFAGSLLPLALGQSPATTPVPAAIADYRQAQAALSRNDLPAARHAFERALQSSPRFEQGHAGLGIVLLRQGDVKGAVRELETARSLSKVDLNANLNLAVAYQTQGEHAKAVPLFASVIAGASAAKQPVPAFVWQGYGRSLAATGKLAGAAQALQTALAAEPKDPTLHGDLGSIYAQQKDWQRAESEFAAEVALDPNQAVAHLRLGLALQAEGKPDAAGELEHASQMAPEEAGVQLEWAKFLATSGEDARAVPVFERVLAMQPTSLDAADQLGQAYQRLGRVPEAIELFKRVLASQPQDATALTNLGMAYTQLQRATEAVPVLKRATAVDPGNATAHQDLAAAYVQLSQFADAAAELRMALKLQPDAPQLHYDLGLALKDADDAAGAIPELQKAEALDARAPEPPYLLGVLYLQAGRYEEASRELQTSLRLRRENGDGWATLGSVYSKLDRLPEAVDALHEAIRQLPLQADPHLTLAAVLSKQNLQAEAAAERKQAAALMRTSMNRQRAEVATNSGKSLLKKGDLTGATQQFQDALSYDGQYADAHLGLADVYQAQGRAVEAASERQKAAAESKSAP